MALRFIDSFDHYTTIAQKWTSSANTTIIARGRTGPNAMVVNQWGSAASVGRLMESGSHATWIIGAAVRWDVLSSPGNYMTIFTLRDGATSHVHLQLTPTTSKLRVIHASGAVIGSETTAALPINVWHYIEFKVTIHDTLGAVEVRVNGVTVISATNVDTRNGATATADSLTLAGVSGVSAFGNIDFDDLYACDGAVGEGTNPCNDFLGDVRVDALDPNGNGTTSQLLGSDGNSTDNYLLVDETPHDSDTTYVESATVGQKDTYAYENHPLSSGTIYGIQTNLAARKTDAGTRKVVSVTRVSAVEDDSVEHSLSTSYAYYRDIREVDPSLADWTITTVNSAEHGAKVTA